ncbi:hypothetical protein [Salinimicrobium soli]|uniref:hypothetical protein n=1 Tax=Salinimicrobium soli TaxID=1254399 RepID=UPI003AADB91D
MKQEQDYIRDIAEIRSMMERSSKFLSLAGWAGILAGIFALAGAYLIYAVFDFNPDRILYTEEKGTLIQVLFTGFVVLLLAVATAIYFSARKAAKLGEKIWNSTSRRLVDEMAVPLVTGGLLILLLIWHGLLGLIAPLTLLFYGLSLYNAGRFTYTEIKVFGILQIILGLINVYFIEYGLLIWAIGFGLLHIIYGIYIHLKYER